MAYITDDKGRNFAEALADIAYSAGWNKFHIEDSRANISLLIEWAEEFHEKHRDTDWTEVNYMETVDAFTWAKIRVNRNRDENYRGGIYL